MVALSKPVAIELIADMPGPPEVVWELITDWERQGEWMLEASDFVVTSSVREGVGTEAEATIKIAGIKTRDRVRVVEWEPPYLLGIEHLGWVSGVGRISLEPTGSGSTTLSWREELRSPSLGPFGIAGLSALRPVMRRIFERDLRVLQSLVGAYVRGGEIQLGRA